MKEVGDSFAEDSQDLLVLETKDVLNDSVIKIERNNVKLLVRHSIL